jgi:hypothetical protein
VSSNSYNLQVTRRAACGTCTLDAKANFHRARVRIDMLFRSSCGIQASKVTTTTTATTTTTTTATATTTTYQTRIWDRSLADELGSNWPRSANMWRPRDEDENTD